MSQSVYNVQGREQDLCLGESLAATKQVGIVGGGVNGICTAIACARAGHQVTCFERGEPFAETSSRSSRMLHGGIRYLEHGHFGLVREALIERDEWLTRSPEYTRVERFFFPIYDDSPRGKWLLTAGTKLYQWLAGRYSVGPSSLHSRAEALELNPALNPDGLKGAVSYCDVVMDDQGVASDLLTEAQQLGVSIKTQTQVRAVTESGNIELESGESEAFDTIVNAAGPWASQVLNASNLTSNYEIAYVQGSHLMLDLVLENPLVFQSNADQRIIFAIPFSDETLLGTTEAMIDIEQPIECSQEEEDYLLTIASGQLSPRVGPLKVHSRFAGVRPIYKHKSEHPKNMSKASRDSVIEQRGKLISVFGGKWTSASHLGDKVCGLV
ncbi:MAG: FAD-dependent oxidoreductase [Halieaceae bacterium MED-G27]|jgi:glycerol-3-phosphate dehydrogenase|nr:MAG: FAD-dependent oxidoreductase [Halieaceae bacterium MED-G27]|tara:strand:- start:7312 stop:8460 length:1149 start_codon:yes stop_codon:yes gene_type:complete